MDDNNQQWYPETDQEQKDLVEKQQRDVVSSLPVVQEVLDWLDKQIEVTRGIELIDGLNPSSNAEAFKSAGLLTQGMHNEFKKKRSDFEAKFSRYITEVADGS